MSCALQQHILRLQVAVNEAQQMQVLQREQNLGGVEARMRLREALVGLLVQQLEQFAAGAELRSAGDSAQLSARGSARRCAPP